MLLFDMTEDQLSQARAFWTRAQTEGWSDERIRNQARQELGVVQIGGHFFFRDGSSLRDTVAVEGRKSLLR
jgi:hypothetical protein